jgi:hypothetical protein
VAAKTLVTDFIRLIVRGGGSPNRSGGGPLVDDGVGFFLGFYDEIVHILAFFTMHLQIFPVAYFETFFSKVGKPFL